MFPSFEYLKHSAAEWFLFPFEVSVPANSASVIVQIPIGNGFHFWSSFVTMAYTTIQGGADDGVCRLSVVVRDQSRQRALFNDFTRLDTIATPGRQRQTAIAGDPSQSINVQGLPFPYLFFADSLIELEFRSTASSDNDVRGGFHGLKYPVSVYGKSKEGRADGQVDQIPDGVQ